MPESSESAEGAPTRVAVTGSAVDHLAHDQQMLTYCGRVWRAVVLTGRPHKPLCAPCVRAGARSGVTVPG